MLILVSQSDTVHMRHFYDAGATHFLSSPMSSAGMAHAIRFAQRHVERMAGWNGQEKGPPEPLGWRFDPAMRSLQLTPALAGLLGLPEAPGTRGFFAKLDPADRALARNALKRLNAETPSTAFAHDLAGVGRVVQHLQYDAQTNRLHALVEALGVAPDANAAVRDALTGARDGPSARRWIDRRLAEGGAIGLVLIGLTRFETVNTAYGRTTGDELLRASRAGWPKWRARCSGKSAIVARIGGSEFLVASDDADAAKIASAAARLDDVLARPFVAGGDIAPLGARLVTGASGRRATMPRRCCAGRARRCSATCRWRRARRRSTCWSTACTARWSAARSACCSSRRWRSRPGRSSASRRSPAGTTRNSARSAPRRCSPRPSAPGSMRRSAIMSSAARWRLRRTGRCRSTSCGSRST
jgi:GGDEF domain-containing protein